MKRLATQAATAAVPVVDEPAPVLDPALGAPRPVDVVDVLGVIGMTPVREHEDDLAPQLLGDVALMLQEVFAFLLAEVGVHLLGPVDHHRTANALLVSSQEAERIVDAIADGQRDGQRLRELPDSLGVVRADQSREEYVADLPLKVSRRTQGVNH